MTTQSDFDSALAAAEAVGLTVLKCQHCGGSGQCQCGKCIEVLYAGGLGDPCPACTLRLDGGIVAADGQDRSPRGVLMAICTSGMVNQISKGPTQVFFWPTGWTTTAGEPHDGTEIGIATAALRAYVRAVKP